MDDISFFQKMVEIDSVTGNTKKLSRWLHSELQKMGFSSEIDSHGNVIACNQQKIVSKPDVLFCGHLDTVPGNIPVRLENNQLFGRGSVDAKGPLAAFILAVKRLGKSDFSVVIVAVPDEEGPSNGAKGILNRFSPRFCVIGEPSGVDGITIGYRGVCRVTIEYSQPGFHKGGRQLGSAEKTIVFWNQIQEMCEAFNADKPDFECLDASIANFNTESDGLYETTVLELSVRLPVGIDEKKTKELFSTHLPGFGVSVTYFTLAFRSGRANLLANSFSSAIRSQQYEPVFKVKTGTADFNLLGPVWNVPIIAYGSGDAQLDHTPNEHSDLGEFLESITIIENALQKLSR